MYSVFRTVFLIGPHQFMATNKTADVMSRLKAGLTTSALHFKVKSDGDLIVGWRAK